MNSSDSRRAEERAERRRSERLEEKAEEQRDEERAEERRRQEARDEAAARAAEEHARERRAQRLAGLRRERIADARSVERRNERRLERNAEAEQAARSEQRVEQARERRREQQLEEQRTAAKEAEAKQAAARERQRQKVSEEEAATRTEEARAERASERRARAREEEQAQQRVAELRAEDAQRRTEDRRAAEAEAERAGQLREERRRALLEERRRSKREAEASAERLREARAARVRELLQTRAAAEAERDRAAERRALEARRRGAERRAQEEQGPAELPWLRTEDGRIVEWGGMPKVLRGVNVVGLDEAAGGDPPLREALALDDRSLEVLSERWGVSFVRVLFSAGTILGLPPILDHLDELVHALAGSGLYVLLALNAPEGPPDQGAHDVWALLAERYQNQPAALFEAFVTEAAIDLVRTMRAVHQSSLLFFPMSGGVLPVPNVAYTLRDTRDSRPRLDETFAAFAARNPVLVSEWANEGPDFGRSAAANAGLFERLDIGWCACNWNAPPRLVADAGSGRFSETRFGLIVRRALAAPVRPALTPF